MIIRVSDEQAWPDSMHSAAANVFAAVGISLASRTPAADLPPNSRVQRAIRAPQMEPIVRPAALEPVKLILSIRGSRTNSSDTCRSAVTTLKTPGGSPTD